VAWFRPLTVISVDGQAAVHTLILMIMNKLTTDQKRDLAALVAKKDEEIDFSDVPAVLDWSQAEIGKFYRPPEEACDDAFGR